MKKIIALLFIFMSPLAYCAGFEDRDEDFFNIHSALLPLQEGGDQSLDSRFIVGQDLLDVSDFQQSLNAVLAVPAALPMVVFEGLPSDLIHLEKFYSCRHKNCFERFSTIENQETHEINIHGQLYSETYNFLDQLSSIEHSSGAALAVAADIESMPCSVELQSGQNRCDFCKIDYKFPSKLKEHIKTHSGEKLFHCKVCSKHFSRNSSLKRHMTIHTGQKLFSCEICGKAFSVSSNLKAHKLVHLGDRSFDCQYCGASFVLKGNLTKHIKTHTGKRSFRCEFCDSSFAHNGNLKVHKRKMHSQYSHSDTAAASDSLSLEQAANDDNDDAAQKGDE